VRLKAGAVMDWHSTQDREELLIMLAGQVDLQRASRRGIARSIRLRSGQCAWLPSRTIHRVVNDSRRPAQYLYVTGRAG
jgi:mannose-6-phosphate isomerase-like protein (cupin superfamily)